MTKATTTSSIAKENIMTFIDTLSADSVDKLASYAAFLRREEEIEAMEDAEDIAYINSLKPEDYENAVPLEEVIADYEKQHGPLR